MPHRSGQSAWLFADDKEARFEATLHILREIDPVGRGMTAAVLTQKNDVAAELADGSPTALRWTKMSLNNWYRQVAGSIFDASLALEFYGFGGPEVVEIRKIPIPEPGRYRRAPSGSP